jgi:hypothetical protein
MNIFHQYLRKQNISENIIKHFFFYFFKPFKKEIDVSCLQFLLQVNEMKQKNWMICSNTRTSIILILNSSSIVYFISQNKKNKSKISIRCFDFYDICLKWVRKRKPYRDWRRRADILWMQFYLFIISSWT